MDNHKSLTGFLESLLREAEAAHRNEVDAGHAVDGDWPAFYAAYLSGRLAPYLGGVQGHVTADNTRLPQFRARVSWVGPDTIAPSYGRYHVG